MTPPNAAAYAALEVAKRRVDSLLLERGLAETREKARALVLAGSVSSAGRRIDKPGQMLPEAASLQVAERRRYVSRGGEKLEAALAAFSVP
ncbi:MAG TPA: S4 domain-containing protein, partial [Dehalococcoidia bacterium]|nr:S4 domain-containing protein [Dehalococcoidia bacterium]